MTVDFNSRRSIIAVIPILWMSKVIFRKVK